MSLFGLSFADFRSFFRTLGWPGILAGLTVLLGMPGHLLSLERPVTALDWFDAALASVRFLVFDGFVAPVERCDGVDTVCRDTLAAWCLRGSQVCAVLFVLLTAEKVLRAATGGYERLRFRHGLRSGRELDLLIGLGWHGCALLEKAGSTAVLRHGGPTTLAVDMALTPQAKETCLRARASVLEADGDSDDFWRDVDLRRIGRIFLATGSDQKNAAILRRLSRQVGNLPGKAAARRPRCFVAVASFSVLDVLLDDHVRQVLDIRPFNDADTTVRLLCRARDEARSFAAGVDQSRLVVIGAGVMADALLRHWITNQVFESGITTRIDVVCPDAHAAAADFAARHPCYRVEAPATPNGATRLVPDQVWLDEGVIPQIAFHGLPASDRGQIEWVEAHLGADAIRSCNTTVAVVHDGITEAARIAKAIRPTVLAHAGRLGEGEAPGRLALWVYLNTKDDELFGSLHQLLTGRPPCENAPEESGLAVYAFRDYLGRCSRGEVASDVIERAAMRVHAVYSGAVERTPTEVEALWHAPATAAETSEPQPPRTEWDRESSRLAGAHAWVKRGIEQRLRQRGLDTALIQRELACVEHRRWCAVHLMFGWRPLLRPDPSAWTPQERADVMSWYQGKKPQFRERKLHLCLLPFEALAALDRVDADTVPRDREQEKDHRIVEATSAIVAFAENLQGT